MTDKHKEQALRFRAAGWSYSRIADALQLSVNTVKSFFRRQTNPIAKKDTTHCSVPQCPQCGKALTTQSRTKPRRFCSDACRMAWWREHRAQVNRKVFYSYNCPNCGSEFISFGNKQRKYCCHSCYIEARFGGAVRDS